MTEASATALAYRMSLELVPVDCTVDGQVTRLLQLNALCTLMTAGQRAMFDCCQ
jgi:hypothetical protein